MCIVYSRTELDMKGRNFTWKIKSTREKADFLEEKNLNTKATFFTFSLCTFLNTVI